LVGLLLWKGMTIALLKGCWWRSGWFWTGLRMTHSFARRNPSPALTPP